MDTSARQVVNALGAPPREPPEKLRKAVRGRLHIVLGIVGVIVTAFLAGIFVILLQTGNPWDEADIRARGAVADGTVLSCRRTSFHYNNVVVHAVVVRYSPAGAAAPTEREFNIGGPLSVGRTVKVAYVPENPERATLVGLTTAGDLFRDSLWILVPAMGLAPVGLLVAALLLWRRSARRLALLREGEIAIGRFEKTTWSGVHVGRKYYRWVHYTYPHPSDGEVKGRALANPDHIEGLSAGSELAVLYDPYRSRRSTPVFPAQLD